METDESGNPLAPERLLTVFPGMELTLAVPCQALVILTLISLLIYYRRPYWR